MSISIQEKRAQWKANWRKKNKEKENARRRERRMERRRETGTDDVKEWRAKNPDKTRILYRHRLARQAKYLKQMPPWVNMQELKAIYAACPPGLTVDHMVPITSDVVCGLHVPWNLQYLELSENIRKGNKLVERLAA